MQFDDDTAESASDPREFDTGGADLNLVLRSLSFFGADPTTRFVAAQRGEIGHLARATWTPDGPASTLIRWQGNRASVCAWGPGAKFLDTNVDAWCGLRDDVNAFTPEGDRVFRLHRRFPGMRLSTSNTAWHDIAWIVVQQMVRTRDASSQWRRMVHAWGENAPGPLNLLLPPSAAVVAKMSYAHFHGFGIEQKRANTLRRVANEIDYVEKALTSPPREAQSLLQRIAGVGPWTALSMNAMTQGDPDALILGDHGLPSLVTYALAGEERGDDARMEELLLPFAGQRLRVVRLLSVGAKKPPRRAPRRPKHDIRFG